MFTTPKKTRTYNAEFKAKIVKKTTDNNGNISATERELGLPMQTLFNWQNKARQGKLIGTNNYEPEYITIHEEKKRLK